MLEDEVEEKEPEAEEAEAEDEGEETAKPEGEEEGDPKDRTKKRIKGLSARVRRGKEREARLEANQKVLMDRIAALENAVTKGDEDDDDDFKITDDTTIEQVVAWQERKRRKDRDKWEKEQAKRDNQVLYRVEQGLHADYDEVVGRWQVTIESSKEMMEKIAKAKNPAATLYKLAKELDAKETDEVDDNEDEETEDAKEQLRGPRGLPSRSRPGKSDRAAELAAMEAKFGMKLDPKKFNEIRTRNDAIRAKRRAAR